MRVSVSKWFFDQCFSVSQGQLSDRRGSSDVQRFHLPFMWGVSKSKSTFQAPLKNGLLPLLVSLGFYLGVALAEGLKKTSFWLIVAEHVSSTSLYSCVRVLMAEEQQNPISLQFCKKQWEPEAQWIQSTEESWLLQSNFFLRSTLDHMSYCRYSQKKDEQGTIRCFCWTLIIVLPSWTWHLTQCLIPVLTFCKDWWLKLCHCFAGFWFGIFLKPEENDLRILPQSASLSHWRAAPGTLLYTFQFILIFFGMR